MEQTVKQVGQDMRNDAARQHNKKSRERWWRLEELFNNAGNKPSKASPVVWFPATIGDFEDLRDQYYYSSNKEESENSK
ncbi:17049_t:CDS:1, partial [Acaulospora colombiana]